MAEAIKQCIEEVKASADRSLAYSNLIQIHRLSANDPSSMESLALYSPPLVPILVSDIHCQDEEIAAQALKCLGFMLYHPTLVPIFSDDISGRVLDSLAKLIMETRMKAICNLGVWCISVQQLGDGVIGGSRVDLLLQAVVHALDNPFGSLSTTFEAIQAVALDLKKKLLQNMLCMLNDVRQKIHMIRAWGWYISLLGSGSLKNRHLLNEMLKILAQTFTDPDPQVQIASLVAWEQLIGALVPAEQIELETNYCDKISGLLKITKVLMMPLERILASKCDGSVHSSCLKTWHFLLHKLGVSVNHPSILMTSFWPILESIFTRELDSMQSTSLWTSCLDLLDDHIRSKVRALQFYESPDCVMDKFTRAGAFVTNKVIFNDFPIKWLPWEVRNLDGFLKIISLILERSLVITVASERRKSAFNYCFRILRSVLWGVKVEIKMLSASYDSNQFCITSVLTFLKDVSQHMASKYCDKQCNDFLLLIFQFVEATREEIDPLLLACPLYLITLDLKCIKEMQFSGKAEALVAHALGVSSLVYEDMVPPMVYITILDLCLMAQSVQHLLMSEMTGFLSAAKHMESLLFSASPLLNLCAAISFLYMNLGKHTDRSFCLLMIWRIIAKGFQKIVHGGGESFLNFESDDAVRNVAFQFLCYPFVMILYTTEVSAHKCATNDSDICLVSSEREIEMELMIEAWQSLFESLSSGSQNQALQMNNCADGLSKMLITVLDLRISLEIQGNTQFSIAALQNTGFHLVFGKFIICILKHAQVLHASTSGSDMINQESSSQNEGSPIGNCLGLVARFMKMSVEISITNLEANMIICRVFAALTSLIAHICLKPDILLLMELTSDPLLRWLSWRHTISGEMQHSNSIMHQLQGLWTEILSCLQRSQPAINFDARFLGVRASLLQASLDHFHSPISEATVAFWNELYNRNEGSTYAECLLPILDKLSRSRRINIQRGNESNFASDNSAGKKPAVLPDKKMSERGTMEGRQLAEGSVQIGSPDFSVKRLKITRHPSNLKGAESAPAQDTGDFNYREERLEHKRAHYVLEKFRRS